MQFTQAELNEIVKQHNEWLKYTSKGNRANLSGADLSGANLSGADLSGANLYGANLSGAILSGANLYGANLSGAILYGANLSGAILYGANLSEADLSGADLSGANLSGANLSGAILSKRYIQVSRIGSRKGMTTYCFDDDIIWCGCFSGNLKDFAERVREKYPDKKNIYRREYEGFIKYIKAIK